MRQTERKTRYMIYKKYVWQFASNMPLPLIKIEASSKSSLEKTQ